MIIAVEIDAAGGVTSAKVKGNGMKMLVLVSERAALRWRFSPASKPKRSIDLTFMFRTVPKGDQAVTFLLPYRVEVMEPMPVVEKRVPVVERIPVP